MGDRRRHQSGALNGAASGGEENAVEKTPGTPERSSPVSQNFSRFTCGWSQAGFMPAPTFLFALAPQAGARLLCAVPGGKTHNSNFTKKQKVQYIISGNKRQ